MYLCVYVSMYLCIYVSMYLCIYVCLCIYIYIYRDIHTSLSLCIHIYIYIYINRPRGDRKFGGCCLLGCLDGDFGESVLKERRSERARLD